MPRTCPCGFEAPPNVPPDSPEWHRGHRDAHLVAYPNVDEATKVALDQLVSFAEHKLIVPAPVDPLAAARALVEHMFARIEDSRDFTYQVGFGSQTRHLLVQAAVALFPETRSAIGDRLAVADHKHARVSRQPRMSAPDRIEYGLIKKRRKRREMKKLHDKRRAAKICLNNKHHGPAHKGGRCKPCWERKLKNEQGRVRA